MTTETAATIIEVVMKKAVDKDVLVLTFRLMLALTVAVTLIAAAFIVFAFVRMEQMELYTCLVTGLCMLMILVSVSLTLWFGIRAYRE